MKWRTWLCRSLAAIIARKPRAIRVVDTAAPLANSGLCVLNGTAADLPRKTVIVIGLARGGTSMVAGALEKLGVYMGDTAHPLYEDRILGRPIEDRNLRVATRLIQDRNSRHEVWGIKNPARVLLTRSWHKRFREPVHIVVFRDAMAIANRRAVSREKDLFGELSIILAQHREMVEFLKSRGRPALLVSYEKALINPTEFVTHLAAFLGIQDACGIAEAARFVQPSPEAYHAVARYRSDWNGHLDVVTPDRVMGWAFRTGDPEPVVVRLTVNGESEHLALADLPRPDVKRHYQHPSDRCGFAIQLPHAWRLKTGDTVSVRLQGEAEDINNSPRHCP